MRRRAFLSTLAAGGTAGIAGCDGSIGGIGGGDPPPRLSVDGRWLVDPAGNRVVLRGVNVVDPWWGTEYAGVHGKNYWDTLRLATSADRDWYARILRVPLEPRTVENAGMDAVVNRYLDRVVELTRRRGVYVILDYHAVERYDTGRIDDRIRRFWSRVASRYADQPHVLYELFNEPTQPADDSLEIWKNWRETAQPWVDLVRRNAPETPLIVGSPRWSSLVKYAPEAPFEGDDLLYSAHVFPSWGQETWEPTFGEPAREVPLFVTEWGYVDVKKEDRDTHMIGSTSGWGEPFREWVDDHGNVNWTAWCFSSEWTPPMFDGNWNLLGGDAYMGEFTRTWLKDERDADQPAEAGATRTGGTTDGDGSPPTAPTNVSVDGVGPTAVWLSWDAAEDPDGEGIAEYRVTMNDTITRTTGGSETALTVRGADTATTYEITVTAVDGDGLESEPSEPVTATTSDPTAVAATLPRADAAPTVDATAGDAWSVAEARPVERALVGDPTASDLAAEWRGCWDGDGLYVLVGVSDDERSVGSGDAYNDDSVEFYLDPDHSREDSYDHENDAQFVVRRGESIVNAGANSIAVPDGVAVAQRETDAGWTAELFVPWSPLGVSPAAGDRIGLDVHVNDDDDGTSRDGKLAWYATADDSWSDPRTFPTVELGD